MSILLLRCVDYVGFDRGGFGVTESCGNAPDDNMLSLNTSMYIHTIILYYLEISRVSCKA